MSGRGWCSYRIRQVNKVYRAAGTQISDRRHFCGIIRMFGSGVVC